MIIFQLAVDNFFPLFFFFVQTRFSLILIYFVNICIEMKKERRKKVINHLQKFPLYLLIALFMGGKKKKIVSMKF
jgi:hypothetical protein